jgi:NAD(P)-dependent dehydrogenase (short-subunit alcohol dehydrogenase family)
VARPYSIKFAFLRFKNLPSLREGQQQSLKLGHRLWPQLPGGLDILINNAGILRPSPVKDISLEDINALLNINVRAPIVASKARGLPSAL